MRIGSAREEQEMTLDQLAAGLGVSVDTVRNWLAGRTRIDPAHLETVASVLRVSVVEQAELLGFLPTDIACAALDLEAARLEADMLRTELRAMQAEQWGAGVIAGAALRSGNWKVAVEPLYEGPDGYKVRTSDLVRLEHRLGGSVTKEADAEKDPGLADALSQTGTVRAWWETGTDQAPGANDVDPIGVFYAPILNRIHAPADDLVETRFQSIAVMSFHVDTWAVDVASLVGQALGFASGSTSLYTRLFFGPGLKDRDDERRHLRARQAEALLGDPTGRASHLVWGHSEWGAVEPFIDHLYRGSGDPLVVFLRPTDRLLEYIEQVKRLPQPVAATALMRDHLDQAVESSRCPTLVVDIGYPEDLSLTIPRGPEIRNAFLTRSMIAAAEVVRAAIPSNVKWKHVSSLLHSRTEPGFKQFVADSSLKNGAVVAAAGVTRFV